LEEEPKGENARANVEPERNQSNGSGWAATYSMLSNFIESEGNMMVVLLTG
jgi:hypothetical protein